MNRRNPQPQCSTEIIPPDTGGSAHPCHLTGVPPLPNQHGQFRLCPAQPGFAPLDFDPSKFQKPRRLETKQESCEFEEPPPRSLQPAAKRPFHISQAFINPLAALVDPRWKLLNSAVYAKLGQCRTRLGYPEPDVLGHMSNAVCKLKYEIFSAAHHHFGSGRGR